MPTTGVRLTFSLDPTAKPQRLDAVVVGLMREAGHEVSRSTVRQWIDEGRVLVDDQTAKASSRPAPGARIDVSPAPAPPSDAVPDRSVPVQVLHQDDALLVVNKPAGLVVHPARGHATGTLVNGLLALSCFDPSVVDRNDPDASLRPGIVHRLDKDTSGVLVVARTGRAREGLKDLFARHDIERVYQAVVVGSARAGTYDTPYGRHPTHRLKFWTKNAAGDKRAITHVQVQQSLASGRATLVGVPSGDWADASDSGAPVGVRSNACAGGCSLRFQAQGPGIARVGVVAWSALFACGGVGVRTSDHGGADAIHGAASARVGADAWGASGDVNGRDGLSQTPALFRDRREILLQAPALFRDRRDRVLQSAAHVRDRREHVSFA